MADGTKIEWSDATWNVVTGCAVVSPGCTNCYAMRLAGTRMKHTPSRQGLTRDTKAGPVWTGEDRFNEQWLDQPLRWRKPRRVFVCAHGDLFAEGVPDDWIDRVFAVMALAPQHTFQVLTKRAERMRRYFERLGAVEDAKWLADPRRPKAAKEVRYCLEAYTRTVPAMPYQTQLQQDWPLPNVWLGTSVEDQARADERIPHLLLTPAAVRFLSCEPMLGQIDLSAHFLNPFGFVETPRWVIAGGESGPGARPMHPSWARSLRDQCAAAGVPFFFKQWGEWVPAPPHFDTIAVAGGSSEPNVCWPDGTISWGSAQEHGGSGRLICRVGKAAAGRLLDGREHSEFPA